MLFSCIERRDSKWNLSKLLRNKLMKAANYGEVKAFSRMEERRSIM